jgi:DNA-directed RNA polymerase subunit RPC12/RpoP
MDGPCPKCGAHLSASFVFCPACGTTVASLIHREPPPPEKAPVKQAFSGMVLGAIVAPAMIITGVMLCCTLLGAFLGVPLIIGGALAPVVGPMVGVHSLRGNCPWCGAKVSSLNAKGSFECDACRKRVEVKDHKFVQAA